MALHALWFFTLSLNLRKCAVDGPRSKHCKDEVKLEKELSGLIYECSQQWLRTEICNQDFHKWWWQGFIGIGVLVIRRACHSNLQALAASLIWESQALCFSPVPKHTYYIFLFRNHPGLIATHLLWSAGRSAVYTETSCWSFKMLTKPYQIKSVQDISYCVN